MPKKTRRQKVISAYRHKLKLLEQLNQQPIIQQVEETKTNAAPKKVITEPPQEKKVETIPAGEKDLTLKIFFKKDLRKSLLLIALIIALEIIIYFGTINNYFRL